MEDSNEYFRTQLVKHILGGNAFKKIEDILEEVPFDQLGRQFEGLPYTFWQQFEHMRIAQKDILDFTIHENFKELEWPKDYWTEELAPKNLQKWEMSKEMFFNDRKATESFILDRKNNLSKPLPQGTGQTLLREALLILEHNAYHTGQMMIIVRLIEAKNSNT